jgi:glycosyltransferase involved in cell wall biosynthesis
VGLRINLVYNDNTGGTPRTALVVARALEGHGIELTRSPLKAPPLGERIGALALRSIGRPRFDLNLFLEQVCPRWHGFARRNLLVPNQEWFEPEWIPQLPRFDLLLCKTRDAERRFAALGAKVRYVGFSSRDQRIPGVTATGTGALHVAGRNRQKGTEAVIRVWQRHPEWPRLTVVQRRQRPEHSLWHPELPNVTYHSGYLPDETIRELQNTHWLHLGPSQAEGFGHSLAESMSCGAVVVTTDAPPMNELVQPGRGLLVPARELHPQGVGMLYQVDEDALEAIVQRALALSESERRLLGQNARAWFEANEAGFGKTFADAVMSAA